MKLHLKLKKKITSINRVLCRRCTMRLQGEKDQWEREIKGILEEKLESVNFKGKVCIKVESFRKALLDKDNCYLSIKALIDALGKNRLKVIEDDSLEYVVELKVIQYKSKMERTEVTIESIGV